MAGKRKKNENRITYLSVIKETLNISGIFRVLKASLVIFLALFIIDYYNIISKIIEHISMTVFVVSIIVLILFVGTLFAEWHILSAIKNKSVNLIDDALLVTIIVSFILLICSLFGFSSFILPKVVCFIISITLFLNRCYIRCKAYDKSEKKENKLLDLKDIYENHINYIDGNKILLSENDVEYDLLNRKPIIHHLYMSIISSMSDKSFVISLEGEWGAGKTTILNGVKKLLNNYNSENNKSEEIVIIDDFEPWTYGNQEALLAAMFDKILVHSGINYNSYILRNIKRSITKAVVNSNLAGSLLYDILKGDKSPDDSIERLKQMILSYIKSESKTFVFYIDNLDRIEDNNIVFLFKLISVIFNFPRMIYVLSFERDRIDKVFSETKNIDPRFTEKIINQIISVPSIESETKKSIVKTCIFNILEKYNYDIPTSIVLVNSIDLIVELTDNIRSFKRMINTVLSLAFYNIRTINIDELIAIELIKFYYPDIHKKIEKNKNYFISQGMSYEDKIVLNLQKEKFNKEVTLFFEKFFDEKHKSCNKLLGSLFPYVSQYINSNKVDIEYIDNFKKNNGYQICDTRFFDSYFSHNYSHITKLEDKVLSYIHTIESDDITLDIALNKVKGLILYGKKNNFELDLILELQDALLKKEFKENKYYYFAVSLFAVINDISNFHVFLSLSPRSRTEYIISYVISKCNINDFFAFIKFISKRYDSLWIIYNITYWIDSSVIESNELIYEYSKVLKNTFDNIAENIINKKINLYDSNYYKAKNINGLYLYYKEKEKTNEFKNYIIRIIENDNNKIFKILWDIIGYSVGTTSMYYIKDEDINIFLGDTNIVDEILSERKPRTEDEEFVLKIYEAYKNGNTAGDVRKGLVSDERELNLL